MSDTNKDRANHFLHHSGFYEFGLYKYHLLSFIIYKFAVKSILFLRGAQTRRRTPMAFRIVKQFENAPMRKSEIFMVKIG